MKVVIPVAGLGTRMLPATKSIPKEMLPIADRPLIQLIVNECALAGAKEIVFVTHSSKSAIENHFDTSFELESILEKRVKRQLLEEIQSITPNGIKLIHVRQGYAKGLGHAVLCAKSVIGDEPFAVVLPDVVMEEYSSDLTKDNLASMIKRFNDTGANQIMVHPVSKDEVKNYGIADVNNQSFETTDFLAISRIVEKPEVSVAPSNLSVVGRYVFGPEIWSYLEHTPAGVGDEIQLTDAVEMLLESHPVEAYLMKGKTYDCGSKLGYWECFVEHALRDNKFGNEFKKYLEQRLVKDVKK